MFSSRAVGDETGTSGLLEDVGLADTVQVGADTPVSIAFLNEAS